MTDTIGKTFIAGGLIVLLIFAVIIVVSVNDLDTYVSQHRERYALGSVVTTTATYEYLTNDSFTGVVVSGDCMWDPELKVRNRDGVERSIAIEFLEPMD